MALHLGKRSRGDLAWLDDGESEGLKKLQEAGRWILYTAIAIFLAVVLCFSFGYRTSAAASAMEPGILAGQQVLVNRLSYRMSSPSYGDVIAFYPGGNDALQPLILRVCGVPGDTVQVMDGALLVNGVPSGTSSGYERMRDAGIAAKQITLKEGEYFALGDNRGSSRDSRDPSIGVIRESDIIGRVWLALPGSTGTLHTVE